VTSDIDEFTSQLSADDARVLVDLLKLAVASRAGPRAKETLSRLLTALARFNPAVIPQSSMMLLLTSLLYTVFGEKLDQQCIGHNFDKFKYFVIVVISCKEYHEGDAKLPMQQKSASLNKGHYCTCELDNCHVLLSTKS